MHDGDIHMYIEMIVPSRDTLDSQASTFCTSCTSDGARVSQHVQTVLCDVYCMHKAVNRRNTDGLYGYIVD